MAKKNDNHSKSSKGASNASYGRRGRPKPQKRAVDEGYAAVASNARRGPATPNTHQGQGYGYKLDNKTGADVIAGKHAVLEALEAGVPLKKILMAQASANTDVMERITQLADKQGVALELVPRQRLDDRAYGLNHQGVLATSKSYEFCAIGTIMESCQDSETALVLVLDHLTDVGNFGAIIRTAEVVGAAGIIIPNKRSVDVVASVYKTSAGAVNRIKIAKVANLATACDRMRDNGFWIAGASEKARVSCWEAPMKGKIALIMGSEGEGLSPLVEKKCDFLVKLPQLGQIGSLNVSCATAALGYEWMRQNREALLVDEQ